MGWLVGRSALELGLGRPRALAWERGVATAPLCCVHSCD